MKKIMALLLTMALVFSMTACGKEEEKNQDTTAGVTNVDEGSDTSKEDKEGIAIEEQVLVDENGYKISVCGTAVAGKYGAYTIPLKVENNSGGSITVGSDACGVNKTMADLVFAGEAPDGETTEIEMLIDPFQYNIGFGIPHEVAISFTVFTGSKMIHYDKLTFTTTAPADDMDPVQPLAKVLCESDDVQITTDPLVMNDDGSVVIDFVIENNSDRILTFYNDVAYIDGKEVTASVFNYVYDGYNVYNGLQIYADELERIGVKAEDIKEIKLHFTCTYTDNKEDVMPAGDVIYTVE